MKKNAKTKNAKKNTKNTAPVASAEKSVKGKPGRPLYVPKFPRKVEWTVTDFCVANEVDPETGKGPKCSKLTLIKWMSRDKARKGRSVVKRLDHTAPPVGAGLGRRAFLFSLRDKLATDATDAAPVTPEVSSETAPTDAAPAPVEVSPETTAYEAQKAELLGTPVPVVEIAAPVVAETVPVTPEPEAVPAV